MVDIPVYRLRKGTRVRFRVPGLEPIPGRSRGVVYGKVIAHDADTHRVKVTCPRGHEYELPENMVLGRDGEDLRG